MIEKALVSVENGIKQQIRAVASGRGLSANALALNELCKTKELLEAMLPKEVANKESHTFTCEHCDGSFSKGMYNRWHGDKCKVKK